MTIIEKLDMNVKQANSDFTSIKNKLIEKGIEVAEGTSTAEYAEKVDDVYEAGKKAEYDAFWDVYQENGARRGYLGAFSGSGWSKETLKPKYSIGVDATQRYNGTYMFFHFNERAEAVDFVEHYEELGITLDFSNFNYLTNAFSYSHISRLGVVDFKKITTTEGSYAWNGLLQGCPYLKTIDKLVFYETNPDFNNVMFSNCPKLTNITVEGVIAKNGLNLQWSTLLSKASIESIMTALSTTASGMTITFSKAAVNNAFETSSGAADGSSSEAWLALINSRTNWTISLV